MATKSARAAEQRGFRVVAAIGLVLILVGGLGLAFGWGSKESTSPSTSNRPRPTASPATTPAPETPASFLTAFVAAIRNGDATFLYDRFDPVVVSRYGEAQCRSFTPNLFDPTFALTLVSTSGPATFDYASDGKSLIISGISVFSVQGTIRGASATTDLHLHLVDGKYRTFVDCGSPLPGSS